jgi:hypothetical protein
MTDPDAIVDLKIWFIGFILLPTIHVRFSWSDKKGVMAFKIDHHFFRWSCKIVSTYTAHRAVSDRSGEFRPC